MAPALQALFIWTRTTVLMYQASEMSHVLTRRQLLQGAALAAASACTGMPGSRPAGKRPPNIIFIMADDLGYGELGCYGQRLIQTPQIDRMAREGMLFTHCYSGSPVCAPSRNVLLTGLHTGHCTIRDNSPEAGGRPELFHEGQMRLPLEDSDLTVAEVLKEAGYANLATGKWGLGEPGTPGVPNRQGFDRWFGFLNQNHADDYYTDYLWRDEKRVFFEENRAGKRGLYVHDLFTAFALDSIGANQDRPFFLYLAYTIPHHKLEVPDTAPYTGCDWPEAETNQAAMITRMDTDVGRILDQLEQSGLDRDTIVFFTSDNGPPNRSGTAFFNSCGPFRGHKGTLFEGGIRVPMIARWPGRIPASSISDEPWYFADFLPTAAALAGVTPPECDGVDVTPLLWEPGHRLPERFLYWEFPKDGLGQAVRFGKWKALRRPGRRLELYDLEEDPGESRDQSARQPELVSTIEEYLTGARVESPHWPSGL
jgi:arylsulfatase A-like enzyme